MTGLVLANLKGRVEGSRSAAGKQPFPSRGTVSTSSVIWSREDIVNISIGRPSSE